MRLRVVDTDFDKWWLSNKKMTVKVVTQNLIIIDAAPIVRCFIGQPLQNLIRWMKKMGETEVVNL